MKQTNNTKTTTKQMSEAQVLELLKNVLPKATRDQQLAGRIYQAVESELKAKARVAAFQKFCDRVALPDLDAKTVSDVKLQLAESFDGGDVTLKPNRKEQSLAVEIGLPDGTQLSSHIKVREGAAEESDEQEVALKFVPFPVCLPGDPELVWVLGRHENLSPEEGSVALAKVEEEFWASKTGQKLLRDRMERSFPEFISRVPGGMLSEVGLKRHYKTPEPIKSHRTLATKGR